MHLIQIMSLLTNLFFVILLISGYFIKKHLIKVFETSDSLNTDQVKHISIIVNVIFFTIAIILLGIMLYPYIMVFFF